MSKNILQKEIKKENQDKKMILFKQIEKEENFGCSTDQTLKPMTPPTAKLSLRNTLLSKKKYVQVAMYVEKKKLKSTLALTIESGGVN